MSALPRDELRGATRLTARPVKVKVETAPLPLAYLVWLAEALEMAAGFQLLE